MADIVISGDVSGAVTLTAPAVAGTTTLTLPTTSGTLVVTGGAQTVQFAAGSAASPSITFTGDTNTGIFSPGADSIGFSEGGVESMRIASDGNIGVGTSTTTNGRFTIAGYTTSSANVDIRVERTGVASTSIGNGACLQLQNTTSSKGVIIQGSDDVTQFFNNGGSGWNERMRITSGGNVGIGTSSPSTRFHVSGGAVNTSTICETSNSESYIQMTSSGGTSYIGTKTNGIEFLVNSAGNYAGRFTSSGQLFVGTTSDTGASERFSLVQDNSNWIHTIRNSSASQPYGAQIWYTGADPNNTSNFFFGCYGGGAQNLRMNIRSNGGIANYSGNNVNLSDEREKTNIQLAGSYLDKICAIPVKTFNYIDQNLEEDGGLTLGVIAQDVQSVAPELVMESNWANKDEPEKMRLSIYQTDLQYALMKAIQELNAKVEAQAAEIAALKGAN